MKEITNQTGSFALLFWSFLLCICFGLLGASSLKSGLSHFHFFTLSHFHCKPNFFSTSGVFYCASHFISIVHLICPFRIVKCGRLTSESVICISDVS